MSGWGTIYNGTRLALSQQTSVLAKLQEQVSSGARVNRPSDAPVDAFRILQLRSQTGTIKDYQANLDQVTRTQQAGYDALQSISTTLQDALQKLQQAATDTYNSSSRDIIAQGIDSDLQQVLMLANTSSLARYVFGGLRTDIAPYATDADGQYVTAVRYQGSSQDLSIPVAPGVELPGTLVGEGIFSLDDRQGAAFFGRTGAAAGTGTNSVRGQVLLVARHDQTTVVADEEATGLKLSADGGSADTILGRYDLTVDVPNGRVQFAGGPWVSFTGTETDLAVANADGDVVHLDVTGLNGALAAPATVTIQADGLLSIGDRPAAALNDFGEGNVPVTDAAGRVLYVDATGIRRTGSELVSDSGTGDLFGTLIYARDLLMGRVAVSGADQGQLLQQAIDALQGVLENVTRGMTTTGSRLQAFDTLRGSLDAVRNTAGDQADQIENADVVDLSAELARAQTLYEMTLATASRLLKLSLLDFI